jgi:hypothetical protein
MNPFKSIFPFLRFLKKHPSLFLALQRLSPTLTAAPLLLPEGLVQVRALALLGLSAFQAFFPLNQEKSISLFSSPFRPLNQATSR